MIQNPQKVRYFQSGNCSGKPSLNSLQKMCQNAELVLRFGVIMIRDFIQIFSRVSYEKEEVLFSSSVLVCGSSMMPRVVIE